jgi:hypothetical protein
LYFDENAKNILIEIIYKNRREAAGQENTKHGE